MKQSFYSISLLMHKFLVKALGDSLAAHPVVFMTGTFPRDTPQKYFLARLYAALLVMVACMPTCVRAIAVWLVACVIVKGFTRTSCFQWHFDCKGKSASGRQTNLGENWTRTIASYLRCVNLSCILKTVFAAYGFIMPRFFVVSPHKSGDKQNMARYYIVITSLSGLQLRVLEKSRINWIEKYLIRSVLAHISLFACIVLRPCGAGGNTTQLIRTYYRALAFAKLPSVPHLQKYNKNYSPSN